MEIESQLRNYLEEHYSLARKGKRLKDDTLLLEEKIVDSVGMLELMLFIEETFGIEVPEEDISPDNFGTINRLVVYIDSKKRLSVPINTQVKR
jgi:acyl carrier protein